MKLLSMFPKYNPEMKLLHPQNRGFLFVASVVVLISGVGLAFFLFGGADEKSSMVALDSVQERDVVVAADAVVSEEYGKSIKQINQKAYEKAKQTNEGAVMPILYHDKDSGKAEVDSINSCGCTFDDNAREQLIEELQRLGVTGIKKTDALRVGRSDIYIRGDGSLVDETDAPYLFNGDEISTDSSGALLNKRTGMTFSSLHGELIYLGNEGQIYDANTSVIALKGRILSSSGVILLGNGKLAHRPGGITQVGNSDVYVTQDEQLATMDGKPVLHSSSFVFKDAENRLRNALHEEVYWNNQFVVQNAQGTLTDKRNVKFKKVGILFSFDGILIDNDSMLTGELDNISRFGESDLFLASDHQIVDGYNQPVTNLGYSLKLGTNDVVHSQIGILTRNNAPVILKPTGRLSTDKGVVLTGTLKNSLGVAYDKHGHLITRQGKLARLGVSDIYHTADKYLSDKSGKAIRFQEKDTFQDLNRYKVVDGIDAFGLITYDNQIVKDLAGNDVYLTSLGTLVDASGKELKQSGILKNAENVLINASGELLVKESNKALVTDKFGNPVLYNGKSVFKDADGRLFDETGAPILDEQGRAVFLSDSNVLTDEFGNIVKDDLLFAGARNIDSGEVLEVSEPLLDMYGNQLTFNGEKAFVKDGMLTDAQGNLLLDEFGNPIQVTDDNELVSSNGSILNDKLRNIDGTAVTGKLKRGEPRLTSARGNSIKYKGADVKLDAEGFLLDSNGNRILGNNGLPVKINSEGQIVDSNGDLATVDGLAVMGESSSNGSGLQTLSSFKDADGNEVFIDGRKVFRQPDGSLVFEDGTPVVDEQNNPVFFDGKSFVDEEGNLVSTPDFSLDDGSGLVLGKTGAPLKYKGKNVYKKADGTLVDEFGNEILGDDGLPLSLNKDGVIVTSSGAVANTSDFTSAGEAVVNDGFQVHAQSDNELVLGKDGKPLLFKGKKVFKKADGTLIDEFGNAISDDMGIPLALSPEGLIVTPDGELADLKDFSEKNNSGFTSTSLAPSELVTGPDGTPLLFNGRKVYKKADGTLVDENGQAILGEDNKPLQISKTGTITTSSGKPASMSPFTLKGQRPANRGFKIKSNKQAELVLGKDGSPLMYKGKRVYKREDGTLVDAKENVILSDDNEPLKLDAKGTIRTFSGAKAKVSGFTVAGQAVKNGDFKAAQAGALRTLGDSAVAITDDGLLIDASGKEIKYKNSAVRRAANGQLFDDQGRPLLTPEGKRIFMNDKGEIVDSQGEILPDVILQNGDGQILGNEDSKNNLKRVGKSDLYITRDGVVTDSSSKPMLYKGKPVKVGEGGRLFTVDGTPVTDASGNSVYLTGNGELKNKQRQLIRGAILETSDEVQVDSKGLLVTNGGKLTSIGNGLYKTADGLVVDREGKAVKIDNKQVFVDKENKLVDFYSRPIRFKGRSLTLQPDGRLTDEQGNTVSEGEDAYLLSPDGIVDGQGTLVSTAPLKQSGEPYKPSSAVVEMVQNQGDLKPSGIVQPLNEPPASKKTAPTKKTTSPEKEPKLKVEDLTAAETERLNQRYARIKQNILAKLSGHTPTMRAAVVSTDVALGGETALPQEEFLNAGESTQAEQGTISNLRPKEGGQRIRAGSTIYAVNTMRVNTDLNTNIVFRIMGVPHDHFLFHATAHGKISLRYDYIVMEFNKICPLVGECIQTNAIGVNPATKQANIDGDIDKHYWYRFGGLAMATLVQGAAEAVGESQERTEEIDPVTGKTITYSGLDGDKLLIRSAEKTGEAFASVFMENVNRPYTGIVPADEEISIFLFEDVVEQELIE